MQPADVAGEIEWAKARLVGPSEYAAAAELAGRSPALAPGEIARLYERYEAEKRRRGVVDFDDLLALCATAIEDDADFAAAQRWRFRHLFVDEFQDVNPAQFRLLQAWLGPNTDLCVVGDPNQAIYSWNGADPTLLTRFERRFRGAATVSLQSNYRSTPQILAVANAVLADGAARSDELRATLADGPVPTVSAYDTDEAEARGVASKLRRAHSPGTSWGRLAVLTRTNAQLTLFAEALRSARIPFRIRGGGALLDQPEVKAALDVLRRSRARTPFESQIVELDALAAEDGAEERKLNLEELARTARQYVVADSSPTLDGFVAWLQANAGPGDAGESPDAVELTTFHRAKGLEWPVVFVAGLEKGLAPIGHATTREAEAEERRLVYVALTRARDELHCSWAERRTFGARTVNRSPSPYLDAIEVTCRALQQGQSRPDVRALLAAERSRLRAIEPKAPKRRAGSTPKVPVAGADADLFEALKAWRATAAKAANVPAYVVFHDSTLAAIAAAKPRSHSALLDVPGLGPVKAARYGDALLEVV
ncbi:MAG: 3'-5' exonuclease, partial [Acidimicrobiia bacterium]